MDQNLITLWCAYPDDLLTEEIAQSCEACLSEEEKTRMRAFRFPRDRRVFLASHALLRNALSHSCPLSLDEWQFSKNKYGKPQIPPQFGLRFNLSHCPRLAICLVSRGIEVGVDLEPRERAGDIVELAARVFSRAELIQFERLKGQEKLNRALLLWTLKEAFVKACGMGLSMPLTGLSFLFEGDHARLEVAPDLGVDSRRWQFSMLEHSGHRIAVVTERVAELSLRLCEARPAVSGPRWLETTIGRWH